MAEPDAPPETPLTRDAFFGGRLTLAQPAKGHRGGMDAVLLAAAVPSGFSGLVFDAGAGVGTAGLGVAIACPAARVGLIENDPLTLALARDNIATNGLGDRADVQACDLLDAASRAELGLDGRADLVVTNPPFHVSGTVRPPPDPRRQAAYVQDDPEAWIKACLALLQPHGTLIVIQRVDALPGLLRVLERRAGALCLLAVHTKAGEPAKRILLRATRGSRAPLTIAPGLVLRIDDAVTPEAERFNQGTASIAW